MYNFGLIDAAFRYRRLGFSIVPVRADKSSIGYWTKYQQICMSDQEIYEAFNWSYTHGIAIICGTISGDLEVLDFDCKYDLNGNLFQSFQNRLNEIQPGLFEKLLVIGTRNKGYHIMYRCLVTGRSVILARRPCTEEELLVNAKDKVKVLIEVKANGGYVVAPPTDGYDILQRDYFNIPYIQSTERDTLLATAKSFNTFVVPGYVPERGSKLYSIHESPLLDYNRRGDLFALLERHGWTKGIERGPRTYFRRPGNTRHRSSGDFHHGLGKFGVFSTSTEFVPQKGYFPYAVYAVLECDWNFKLAAKRLLAEGYGIPKYMQARHSSLRY